MTWEDVLAVARRFDDHYSLTEEQQRMIWELAKGVPAGGLIVELGVCHGKTAAVLAMAAYQQKATYRGIDNWSLEGSKSAVALKFDAMMHDLGIRVPSLHDPVNGWDWWDSKEFQWHLNQQDTHDEYWRNKCLEVDFLLIDAGHDEANVVPDCELWIPKVVPGGTVVFDDVPSGPGWEKSAHWAVRDQMEKWTADWEWAASWGKTVARRRPL